MRRIATVVVTGAVATAATLALTVSPTAAATSGAAAASGTALSAAGSDLTVQATKHNWHSYDGFKTVYAHGWYTRTSTRSTVYGYITDSRSGEKYAGVYLKWTETGKSGYRQVALVNPHHHTTASFPARYYSDLTTHLYVAETLSKKVGGKWTVVNKGKLHKIY